MILVHNVSNLSCTTPTIGFTKSEPKLPSTSQVPPLEWNPNPQRLGSNGSLTQGFPRGMLMLTRGIPRVCHSLTPGLPHAISRSTSSMLQTCSSSTFSRWYQFLPAPMVLARFNIPTKNETQPLFIWYPLLSSTSPHYRNFRNLAQSDP